MTSIGSSAFSGCSGLTSITIPNSVTSIGDYAFRYCSSLKSIEIPNSVTSIGSSAFSGCSGLTSITIPNSVTSIGSSAFSGCSGLTSITISNSVTSIGSSAFQGCSKLTSVDIKDVAAWCNIKFSDYTSNPLYYAKHLFMSGKEITDLVIPDSVTSIRNYVLYNCSGLTSITIPNSVTSIGSSAFNGCSGLTEVYCYAENVPTTSTDAFDIANVSNATLYLPAASVAAYMAVEPWNRFGNVKNQGGSVIYHGSCGTNTQYSLDTGTGVLSITGTGAMTDYSYTGEAPWYVQRANIKSVEIADGVTLIGARTFRNCSAITSISISNSVKSINSYAFSNCSGLTSVTIPAGVTSIGLAAFDFNLTSIVVASGNAKFDSRDNCNAVIETATNTLIMTCKNTVIPNSVTSIGKYAFYYCPDFSSVTIPNSVTSIGDYAFYNCSGLTSVDMFSNIESIGTGAFRGTTWYNNQPDGMIYVGKVFYKYKGTMPENTYITIDEGTLGIAGSAFSGCSGLVSVTIPNSVTSIGSNSFSDCSGLTRVTLNSNTITSKTYSSSSTIGSFFGSQVKEYVIGEKVTSIGDYAFYNCDSLTSVTISNRVSSIGGSAFSGCSGLTEVYCNAENVPTTSTDAFNNANIASATLYLPEASVTAYMVVEPWSRFGTVKTQEGSIIYHGSCGDNVWYSLNTGTGVLSITGTGSMTNYSSSSNVPWYSYKSYIKKVEMSDDIISIGNYAFYNCDSLESFTIPNSVTSIGSNAFYGCSGLTSIEIPSSVTSIGSSAFIDCAGDLIVNCKIPSASQSTSGTFYGSKFKSVTIGEGVTSIGSYAFYNCDSLTTVTIPSSVTSIGTQAFSGCSGLNSIEIPNSVTSIGNAAFANCSGELIVNCKIPSASQSTSGTFYGSKFKSVTIGEGVTSIGSYAFYNCDSLTTVTIPNSVTSIEDYSFYGCEKLTRVSINSNTIVGTDDFSLYGIFGSQVKEYILGNDVKSIGGGKFSGCTGLAYITIPNSVKTIGNSAFHNCSKLEYITIPNSVTSIGDYALSDCANLKSVTIGSGVQVIGKNVFENHRPSKVFWLTNTPPEGYAYAEGTINYVSNRQYTEFSNVIRYSSLSSIFVVDGIKYVPVSPSERTCDAIDCTYDDSIETINIGEKVTNRGIALSVKQVCPYTCFDNKYIKEINLSFKGDIGAKAFYGCSNMTTAELGESILSIGESGFSNCSKLESIVIPDSVVSIKDSTFCDCIALDTVKIGKGVENIGRYAFSGCSVLPNIKIPQCVTSIADYAFRGCIGMKTVVMSNGDSELALSSNGSNPLFADCPLDSVYIGRNILYETSADYGYSPFYRNKTLRTVVITDKETEVSDNEFYGCTNLQSFKVGDGVTSFGSWAFSGCSSLKSLSFGSQLQSIGQEAFSDCNSVTVIVSKTEIPPICDNQALEDINKWDCVLYVPEGTKEAYQDADQWKDFFFMEEGNPFANPCGDANGDGEVNMDDATFVANIILGTEEATEAADVNKDGVINMSDVMFIVNFIKNGEFPDGE